MAIARRQIAGRALHPIGLGCMNLSWAYGTPPPRADAVALLNRALDLGYDHLDTANIYGGGRNEELLAEAVMHRRAEFFLASKCGIVVDGPKRGVSCAPEDITANLDASLGRLGTDHIDLFYMHRFDPKVPISDSVGAMVRAIEAGKIGAYGVSEWSAAHIREAHAVHPMAAVQPEYSLWTRNVEIGVLDTCKALGIALVAFSPTGRGAFGGVLRDPATLEDSDLRTKMPRFDPANWPKNLAVIERFEALARDHSVTPAQLALRWVLEQGEAVHVIPGTTSMAHLEENFAAATVPIPAEAIAKAGELVNHQTVHGHRYHDAIRPTIDTEEFA
ncbi:aldo/keto reductase [Erythrobacter arachoides]|uniref:Aldo/keto reductase n=1 Tax=Aurantiacibacter arachoides TaxID=1850444 RepID=A0A844ZY48_9SPHN|nr:aldo/keto reductase [Aurantiacibacter arachoides]MXO92130.1 aldo/keto reductase [Aurantiacibacter arachoides]GGD59472.1 aldo/keto reductase [Aurantiacibacter arachoides]